MSSSVTEKQIENLAATAGAQQELVDECTLQQAFKARLEGVERVMKLQNQYGNLPETSAGANRLLAEIFILTQPGLNRGDFDACISRLSALKAESDAKEAAKKLELKKPGAVGRLLKQVSEAKKDFKENGPNPDMNPALNRLKSLIKIN